MREVEVTPAFVRAGARQKRREPFLRGPIPIRDIAAASRLPGQSLALLLAIHHRCALTGQALVTIPRRLLADLGLSRDAKARALHALEGAGLVRVERVKGRGAGVELCSPASAIA